MLDLFQRLAIWDLLSDTCYMKLDMIWYMLYVLCIFLCCAVMYGVMLCGDIYCYVVWLCMLLCCGDVAFMLFWCVLMNVVTLCDFVVLWCILLCCVVMYDVMLCGDMFCFIFGDAIYCYFVWWCMVLCCGVMHLIMLCSDVCCFVVWWYVLFCFVVM